ncbi:hypothetical protein HN51_033592 [Arachis hypogaea]
MVYSLAIQSHVAVSFEISDYTADVVATEALCLLEVVCSHISATGRLHIRYYQAGSSKMFGSAPPPQDETTPFHPRSPYVASKCAAHWYTVNYREAFRIFTCNGVLFNHVQDHAGCGPDQDQDAEKDLFVSVKLHHPQLRQRQQQ